jgi:hypothetical protein
MNKLMSDIKEVFETEGVYAAFASFMEEDFKYYEEGQVLESALNFKGIEFEVEHHHGGEGQGEDYYTVYKFTRKGEDPVYVKFQGYYYSYDGSTFQDWFFVEPREVLVTQYFPI